MQRFAPKRDYVFLTGSIIMIILAGLFMLLFPAQQLVFLIVIFMAIVIAVFSLYPLRVKGYELREDRIVVLGTNIEVPYNEITDAKYGWIKARYKTAANMISRGQWSAKKNISAISCLMGPNRVYVVTDKFQYLMTPVDGETFVKELNKMLGKTQPE